MAMIPVQMVLEKLAFLAAEEIRLLKGVREGIDILEDDLNSMKAFLQDAEARSENDGGVKAWVKQVRDVAYDAEDVLEEFMFRLPPVYGPGFVHSLRNWYYQIWNLRAQHRLAIQIQSIKGRVKAISERRNAFALNRIDMGTCSNVPVEPLRLASLHIDEVDLVGIENPKGLLVSLLVEGEEKLTSISVVGMGGLGKTTLVKKVYDSQPIRRCFDCYCWVTVSKSFSHTELLRAALQGILEATKEPTPNGMESMTDSQLFVAIKSRLQHRRYIIVFDDVWRVDAWDATKYAFPDSNSGSRIIFTTRSSEVATSIDITSHVYHLQPLTETEAWTLFCKKAFRGEHKGVCPIELEYISKGILRRCEGLPLAIVAIGGLLSKKNKVLSEWRKVHDSLATEFRNDNSLGSLERILLMSYNDLPHHLKLCYLYLSVFPEDYLIKRSKLVRLWIVERIVKEKQGLTMEEAAEDYLNELVSRSMIQVVEMNFSNRVRTCRLHDLMREIIQLKSKEESFVMIATEGGITRNEKVHRLSIHDNLKELSSGIRFPCLRSLFLFLQPDSVTSYPHAFFRDFKLLRVLDLEGVTLLSFPPELVGLIHLRYLNLRRTMITELPESIRKLKYLEVLDMKRSLVSSLPSGILELKNLRRLISYSYHLGSSMFFYDIDGMRVPAGIGRLTGIQKLGSIQVNDDCELVRELGKLTQLRRLSIGKLRKEHEKDLCYSLDRMNHLISLFLVSMNPTELLCLDSLASPPTNLQCLYLNCCLLTLPKWITSLHYLSKLVLQYSKLKSDPLITLQDLPSLVVLEIRYAYDGEELSCDARGYSKLKKLGLYQLPNLQSIKLAEGAMPGLKQLDIAACGKLEMVPQGIEHLTNIEELLLWDMPAEFLKTIVRSDGEDFGRVQNIPTIRRIYESRGRWAAETI